MLKCKMSGTVTESESWANDCFHVTITIANTAKTPIDSPVQIHKLAFANFFYYYSKLRVQIKWALLERWF